MLLQGSLLEPSEGIRREPCGVLRTTVSLLHTSFTCVLQGPGSWGRYRRKWLRCDFLLNHGLFGTYFQLCPVIITGVAETRASQGQCLVCSCALCILGALTVHLDCWPVSGVVCRSEEPDFPGLCFTF